MGVEDVAGVRLAARGPPHEERDLAVRPGVLGQVVVDAQRVAALLHELLANRRSGVRGQELDGRGVRGAGHDHDRVLHRAVLLELGHDLGHGRQLLTDGHVDADQVLALLVDDRVDGDRGLAGLAVAEDELALAATDGDHGVDGLDPGLDRGVHRLADDDAGGDPLDRTEGIGLDGALAVQRVAERVDHPTDERIADRDLDHPAGGLDLVALLQAGVVAQDQGADRLLLEVEGHPHHPARELEQLRGEGPGQAVDLGDAVAHLDDGADAGDIGPLGEAGNLAANDRGDLVGSNGHPVLLRPRSGAPAAVPGGSARWRHTADPRSAPRCPR